MNFRGPTVYGKSYFHKDDRWRIGHRNHADYSIKKPIYEGIADADNICIFGGSYGGYVCLTDLAYTPDYKCGVDIVGPSNIKTFLDSIPTGKSFTTTC